MQPRPTAADRPGVRDQPSPRARRSSRAEERARRAPLYPAAADLHARPVGLGRIGGVATVLVPYEKLETGPVGALFDIRCDGAPESAPRRAARSRRSAPAAVERPVADPGDGRFHLQMVYAVCSLTYAAFKRALGREIPWAISHRGDTGRGSSCARSCRAPTPATAARPAICRSATSRRATSRPDSPWRAGSSPPP